MLQKKVNFSAIRLIYLQSSSHQSKLHEYTKDMQVYSSANTIISTLHHKNYDCLVLDMNNKESMSVLEYIKHNHSNKYVIACSSDPDTVMTSLQKGADTVLINPLDDEECKSALYKLASYLNMYKVFNDTYHIDQLTSCQNLHSLQEKIELNDINSLLRISLSAFKSYEIFYGSEITNKVLIEFGNAIKINLPVNSKLFRTNEDEFSILLKNPSPSQEKILAEQLKSFFELTPIEVDGFLLKIHTNIGIATGSKLLQKSNIALSEAKDGHSIVLYDENSAFIAKQKEQIQWVKIIQDSICEDRVKVYFQPIMDNSNSTITKYEVLCRIEDIDKKLLMPNDFIPSAIIAGRMCDLTRVIIDKSFKFFKDTSDEFSINITREDFLADYLVNYISYKCDYYGIDPKRVYIEILENISSEAANGFLSQIKALKDIGCNISIDDFGVDGSNFSRMMMIDAEVLKIDGHFIQNLLYDNNARIIVENIVDFSKKIGAKTVAEYVDSKEIFDVVKKMGINYSQGYYIGKPSPFK